MNYARIRNKLKEKQKELSKMNGKDRTALEEHLISEAKKESEQPSLLTEEKKVQKNGSNNRK